MLLAEPTSFMFPTFVRGIETRPPLVHSHAVSARNGLFFLLGWTQDVVSEGDKIMPVRVHCQGFL